MTVASATRQRPVEDRTFTSRCRAIAASRMAGLRLAPVTAYELARSSYRATASRVHALLGASADSRLTLRVSPSVAFAPANLFVRATVDVNAENRSLQIIAESTTSTAAARSRSMATMRPRVTLLQFKSVPGGLYAVRAVVRGRAVTRLAIDRHANVNIVGDERSSSLTAPRAHSALLPPRARRSTAGSGSGVKSSPGLMNRSFSNRYCLSYS